jgi:peroxiredoxin
MPAQRAAGLIVVLASGVLCFADDAKDLARPLAEQIAQIAKEHEKHDKDFHEELHRLGRERTKLSREGYLKQVSQANQDYNAYLVPVAKSLIELLKANPKDPAVIDGLVLLKGPMTHSLNVDKELVRIVLEDQIASPKLGRLCHELRFANNDLVAEAILKTASETHPAREVQGEATYALGEYYRQTARDEFGPPKTEEQKEAILANAEKYLALAVERFGDVQTTDGEKIADVAEITLTRVRNIPNLKVGKPAPAVSGDAVDGAAIKLADYRGKVVVVVFWGSWCRPCMAMVPHARELAERMKDKPFVLLGVNCGDEQNKARSTMASNKMTWPSLWDGSGHDGPVQAAFDVRHWPTVYVIDAAGTIRHIEPDEKDLDAAVDQLVANVAAEK